MKHKIVDHIRRASRERPIDGAGEEGTEDIDGLFKEDGHFDNEPQDWG